MSSKEVLDGNAIVYCEGFFNTPEGKTDHGLVRFTERYRVLSVIDSRYAGQDDGRPFAVTLDITLPLILPAMAAGWLLAFTLSLDDLVISSFTAGAGASTLPMVIFSKVKLGVTPEINALATIIIGIVTVGVVIAGWTMLRQQKQLARPEAGH